MAILAIPKTSPDRRIRDLGIAVEVLESIAYMKKAGPPTPEGEGGTGLLMNLLPTSRLPLPTQYL